MTKFLRWFLPLLLVSACIEAQPLETRQVTPAQRQHDEWVLQVAYSPDGQVIASAGLDGRIRFWDTKPGPAMREWKTPGGSLPLAIAFTPDGKLLAAGDSAGVLRLIRVAEATVEREIKTPARILNTVAVSPDGGYIATGGNDGNVRIWRSADGKLAGEIKLVTGEATGTARLVDGKLAISVAPAFDNVASLAFMPNGKELVVAAFGRQGARINGEVGIWQWAEAKRVQKWPGPPAVRGLAVSPDGTTIAVSEFKSATRLFLLPLGQGSAFESSLRLLGESDEPGYVALFRPGREKAVRVIEAELGARALAFAPDGQTLACAGAHGVMLYDMRGTAFPERGRIDTPNQVNALAFHPDGTRLAIAQEQQQLGSQKNGGPDKLLDPVLLSLAMTGKDGIPPSGVSFQGEGSISGGSVLGIWEISVSKKPEAVRLWEAVQHYFSNKTEEAQSALAKVIADYPKYGAARRVQAILSQSDPAKAQQILEESVKADPGCVACYRSLGEILFNRKKFDDSLVALRQVLHLNPDYGLVAGRLADVASDAAMAQIMRGNTPENLSAARAYLEEALRWRPGRAKLYSNLATIYYFAGQFDESLNLLFVAQKLRPDQARTYYDLGHNYRAQGDKANAIRAYRRYVALGEEGEEARVERARKFIEELSKP